MTATLAVLNCRHNALLLLLLLLLLRGQTVVRRLHAIVGEIRSMAELTDAGLTKADRPAVEEMRSEDSQSATTSSQSSAVSIMKSLWSLEPAHFETAHP